MSEIWKPHNYQRTALSFLLSNKRSALFLDPGLGKTSISLSTISLLKYANQLNGVLLICPLRPATLTWPDELTKWINFNNLTHTILHGDGKDSLWRTRKDIYIINPEGLKWLYKELLKGLKAGKKLPFTTLLVDESTKFKSPDSERFKLLADMLPLFNRRHIMTGTPAPRSLLDLWSQMFILDQGATLSNNYYNFRKKYFEANDYNKYDWQLKPGSSKQIHNAIAPYVLEMSAKDYLNLPPIIYNTIKVKLPNKPMKYYKKMEQEFFLELDGLEASADATAQAVMKCHQIANGNVYEDIPDLLDDDEVREFKKTRKTIYVHDAKLNALYDLIDELNGQPLLIAYHYKHDLEALRSLLGDDLPYIGSGVSVAKTKEIECAWNAGVMPVLAGHPMSMAHGLNFQKGGRHICWYSLTWNLEDYIQMNKRLDRPGIISNTIVHHLAAVGTVDYAMLARLGERAKQQINLRKALKEYRLNCT